MSKNKLKKISIRLYRIHDIDLLSFYKNPDIDFKQTVLDTLESYAEGKIYFLSRIGANGYTYNLDVDTLLSKYKVDIYYDENEYPALSKMLKHIKYRWQNAVIKNIMRMYIAGDGYFPCWADDKDVDRSNIYQNKLESILKENDLLQTPVYRKGVQKKLDKINKKNKKVKKDKEYFKDNINSTLELFKTQVENIPQSKTTEFEQNNNEVNSSVNLNKAFYEEADYEQSLIQQDVNQKQEDIKINAQSNTISQNENNEDVTDYDFFKDIDSMLANF